MTEEQARRLIRAAAALPEKMGHTYTFWPEGDPCCAIGHLAASIGVRPVSAMAWDADVSLSLHHGEEDVRAAFGCETEPIEMANDGAKTLAKRRAAVIAEIERQIRAAGHDPDALREPTDGR